MDTARVLLVDDDPIMREMASSQLKNAGYNVVVAENGALGLERLRAADTRIDLVISDIDMPEMDGYELTKNIRSDQLLREIPIIVITASEQSDSVDRIFAAGATSFLAKPMNWTLFSQAVKFVLRASRDQENLRLARDQAEAGAKFKDALMSVMSHELRTPLNAIIGFGQILNEQFETQNDPVYQEYATYIVDGGKRLLNSVSDMLLASDVRSGCLAINEMDTTISEVVDSTIAIIERTPNFDEARITVRLQNPEQEIRCDRALIVRALSKILENSLKFSPKGVQITIGSALTKKGELAILLKDNGPGIPPEKLLDVAVPFTQSDMSLRRSKEGLGLGLPMTKAIAAAHDAMVKLESHPGDGTRILFVFPQDRINKARSSRSAA